MATYDGEPIQAWFHAYSGGETASAKEGLAYEGDEPPYIKRVKIPRNTVVDDELKRWRVPSRPRRCGRALGEADVDVGAIEDITVAEKGPTGRITQVRIKGSGGETTMTGPAFRLALGAFEMKSTKVDEFDCDRDSGLTVSGTGFGHGVGLSQWDALMFAREGRCTGRHREIFLRRCAHREAVVGDGRQGARIAPGLAAYVCQSRRTRPVPPDSPGSAGLQAAGRCGRRWLWNGCQGIVGRRLRRRAAKTIR